MYIYTHVTLDFFALGLLHWSPKNWQVELSPGQLSELVQIHGLPRGELLICTSDACLLWDTHMTVINKVCVCIYIYTHIPVIRWYRKYTRDDISNIARNCIWPRVLSGRSASWLPGLRRTETAVSEAQVVVFPEMFLPYEPGGCGWLRFPLGSTILCLLSHNQGFSRRGFDCFEHPTFCGQWPMKSPRCRSMTGGCFRSPVKCQCLMSMDWKRQPGSMVSFISSTKRVSLVSFDETATISSYPDTGFPGLFRCTNKPCSHPGLRRPCTLTRWTWFRHVFSLKESRQWWGDIRALKAFWDWPQPLPWCQV